MREREAHRERALIIIIYLLLLVVEGAGVGRLKFIVTDLPGSFPHDPNNRKLKPANNK